MASLLSSVPLLRFLPCDPALTFLSYGLWPWQVSWNKPFIPPLCSESGPSVFLYSTLCWNHSWTRNHGHLCVKFTCQGSILTLLESADQILSLKALLPCSFGATILFWLSLFLAAYPFAVSSLSLLPHSSPSCWPVDSRVPAFSSVSVSVLISQVISLALVMFNTIYRWQFWPGTLMTFLNISMFDI